MARKGDLILVETVNSTYVIGQGRSESTEYRFGVVGSATRDGAVKTWLGLAYGESDLLADYAVPIRYARHWTGSAKDVDVEAVLRDAKAHHWPNHPGQPMAYATKKDALAVVRKHRRTVAAS